MSTFSYTSIIPAANNDPADDQPLMLQNFSSISQLISQDHVGFNTSGGGEHEQVTFNANNVPGSFPVSPPVLFTNTVGSLAQLFFYSGSMANSASQYAAANPGSTLVLGGIVLKWGSGSLSFPFSSSGTTISFVSAFPNACFAVLAVSNDAGSGSSANTICYARNWNASNFNLLGTLRTTTGQPGSGTIAYSYLAIGY